MLKHISGFIFDMDGVLFKDYTLLPGGRDMIEALKSKAIPFVFLSNLTTKSPSELHDILMSMGIYVDKEQIITSATLIREYLKENFKGANVKVFGSKSLKSYIYEEHRVGFLEADVIVIGMDPDISISDLSKIRKHIHEGKEVIFSNPDYYAPTSTGYDFDCGVIVELFKPHLNGEPKIIGKPSSYAFEYAISKLNVPREFVAMIGDTYETDIKGAHNCGIIPIHIQTTQDESYNTIKLDAYEYSSLEEVYTEFKSCF